MTSYLRFDVTNACDLRSMGYFQFRAWACGNIVLQKNNCNTPQNVHCKHFSNILRWYLSVLMLDCSTIWENVTSCSSRYRKDLVSIWRRSVTPSHDSISCLMMSYLRFCHKLKIRRLYSLISESALRLSARSVSDSYQACSPNTHNRDFWPEFPEIHSQNLMQSLRKYAWEFPNNMVGYFNL